MKRLSRREVALLAVLALFVVLGLITVVGNDIRDWYLESFVVSTEELRGTSTPPGGLRTAVDPEASVHVRRGIKDLKD